MLSRSSSGSFRNTFSFLEKAQRMDIRSVLESNAKAGVVALSNATPTDTGLASQSWSYEVRREGTTYSIAWTNSDVENGFPVVIMLQYGYGTGTGGYVRGRDFINPAIRPIFDKIASDVWRAVTA